MSIMIFVLRISFLCGPRPVFGIFFLLCLFLIRFLGTSSAELVRLRFLDHLIALLLFIRFFILSCFTLAVLSGSLPLLILRCLVEIT